MQELEKVEVTVVQVPKYVRYTCPHCGEEVEVDFDDFFDDRISDYWPDWEGAVSYTHLGDIGCRA